MIHLSRFLRPPAVWRIGEDQWSELFSARQSLFGLLPAQRASGSLQFVSRRFPALIQVASTRIRAQKDGSSWPVQHA